MQDEDAFKAYHTTILDAIQRSGAAVSHHHGIGKMFAPWLEGYIGEKEYGVFRVLKDYFDPDYNMNPGGTIGPGSQAGGKEVPARVHRLSRAAEIRLIFCHQPAAVWMPTAGSPAKCQCCCVDRLCSRGEIGRPAAPRDGSSPAIPAGLLFHAAAQKTAAHVERRPDCQGTS